MSRKAVGAIVLALIVCLVSCKEDATLRLYGMFSDGMVMQQNASVSVRGTATPGAKVCLRTDWGFSGSVRAEQDSTWSVLVTTPGADNISHTISVCAGDTSIEVRDVLLGEVWMAAGQTNMLMKMTGYRKDTIVGGANAIRTSADSQLRFFQVGLGLSFRPEAEASGRWVAASPETTKDFSALAYFFAKELRDSLHVPIGIIQAAYGGAHGRSFALAEELEKDNYHAGIVAEMRQMEADLNAYRAWLDSLPSISVAPVNGKDIISDVVVYDDYVNIATDLTNDWATIDVPGWWEKQGLEGFDGIVWYAHTVELPDSWVGRPLKMHLGAIDDRDVTYVNSKLVGVSGHDRLFYQQRVYDIPAEVNTSKTLDIKIRVIDDEYSGGFVGCPNGERMRLVNVVDNEEQEVVIEGKWKYMVAGQIDRQRLYFFGMPNSFFKEHPPLAFSANHYGPSMVFNHIVAPWRGYAVRGVIWHQGESDVWNADERKMYGVVLPKVLASFRQVFGNPQLPFLISQLSTGQYTSPDETSCGIVRLAQWETAVADPYSYIVPTLDCGSWYSLHPPFKRKHGQRMADVALSVVYGHDGFDAMGPAPEKAELEKGQAVISFRGAQRLWLDVSKPTPFEVAGVDSVFYPAKVAIEGNKVFAFSYLVPTPTMVRYAVRNCVYTNLVDEDGKPTAAFQIDVAQ